MESILDLYERPIDPKRPRLCFDERPCILLDDVLTPIPMSEDSPKKRDYEYKKMGAVVALLAYNIDTGIRHTAITDTKTRLDYAHFLEQIWQEHYSDAEIIDLVQDNLNTHTKGSFYTAFEPEKARKMRDVFNFVQTPKHGSWLNMAEIEFAALSKQCLNRRIKDKQTLQNEVKQWEKARNQVAPKIHWSFTVDKAREKLAKMYCSVFNNY